MAKQPYSQTTTLSVVHFDPNFCTRARIRFCVFIWLCITCFICSCCNLNCSFCCSAWSCSCCLWSSSSFFLRSVSFAVFSAKYWKESELALLFLRLLFTIFFSLSLSCSESEMSPLAPAFAQVSCPYLCRQGPPSSSCHPFLLFAFSTRSGVDSMASAISSSITSFSVGGSGLMPLARSSLFFLFL